MGTNNKQQNKLINEAQEVYYHYTSLEALFSIINSRTLRLTSLQSSNDKKELRYTVDDYINDLTEICDNETNQDIKQYLELSLNSINKFKRFFLFEYKSIQNAYAFCLSQKRDNLTHWARYANNCSGVCLGINVSALKVPLEKSYNAVFGKDLFNVSQTIYSSENMQKFIRNEVCECFGLSNRYFKDLGNNEILICSNSLGIYEKAKKFFKSKYFIDEDEVRIYYSNNYISSQLRFLDNLKDRIDSKTYKDIKDNFLEIITKFDIKNEHFMTTRNGIRCYHNLCLNEIWNLGVISEIILGPLCIQNKNEFKQFLRSNGLNKVKVSVSKVPIC